MEGTKITKENILDKMEAFDFSAPVNVTVTFEDSDEDKKLCKDNKKEPINVTNSNILRSETLSPSIEKNIYIDGNIEKMCNNRKENFMMIQNREQKFQNNNDIETNSINQTLKRKVEYPTTTPSKQKTLSKDNVAMNDLQNGLESIIKHTITDDDNNLRLTNENKSKRNDGDAEINYVSNLLSTVSKHLTLIMEAFHCYTRIINSTYDQNVIRDALLRYNQIKTHLFGLSYCTVVDLILPRINNTGFIQTFINNTTTMANEKSPCYHFQITSLFTDMVEWTKEKQKYLNVLPFQLGTQHSSNKKCAMLRQQLQTPPKLSKLLPNTEPSKPNAPSIHFSAHTQNSQSHLYTVPSKPNPKLINVNAQSNQPHSHTVTSYPSPPPYPLQFSRNSQSTQPYPYTVRSQPVSNPINRNTSTKSNISPIKTNAQSNQSKSYTVPGAQYPSEVNGNAQKSQQCIFSSGPPGRNINISIHPSLLNNQKIVSTDNTTKALSHGYRPSLSEERSWEYEKNSEPQCNNSNTLPQAPVTIYSNNYINYYKHDVNINNILIQGQHDMAPNDNQNRVSSAQQNYLPPTVSLKPQNELRSQQNQSEPTRSTSTDSGFMSPLNFGAIEPTNSTTQEQQSYNAPLITHVTSLNPKVLYNNEASCHVCGNNTKQMCLGCFKIYYCSTECQKQDWKTHMVNCKTPESVEKNFVVNYPNQ